MCGIMPTARTRGFTLDSTTQISRSLTPWLPLPVTRLSKRDNLALASSSLFFAWHFMQQSMCLKQYTRSCRLYTASSYFPASTNSPHVIVFSALIINGLSVCLILFVWLQPVSVTVRKGCNLSLFSCDITRMPVLTGYELRIGHGIFILFLSEIN